jgi:hypothetical protein
MSKLDHSDAEQFISAMNKQTSKVALAAHKTLVKEGCASYVKTIYIGYDLNGVMVAALYGHLEYVEVALALPERYESKVLIDATHLTWRTLPVAAVLQDRDDLSEFVEIAKVACDNVKSGNHMVSRDNEFFAAAKRERREKYLRPS